MVKPTIIKPRLLKALIGSLNIEELILSHQRQASPITAPGSREGITPKWPKRTYVAINPKHKDSAIGNTLFSQLEIIKLKIERGLYTSL